MGHVARLGHGLQRAFILAALQELALADQTNTPTLLLGFEEPELYQHPAQARHLAEVLEQLTEGNAQVMVTTHHAAFASSHGFQSIRLVRKSHAAKTATVTSASFDDLTALLANALGAPPDPPGSVAARLVQVMQPSQAELYFSRIPVLVEGIEDVALFGAFLHLAGRWKEFRLHGCHFVACDGKTCLSRPLAIAKALDIPAFSIFDADSDATDPQARARHERDNKCILNLADESAPCALPADTHWGKRVVMWATNMQHQVSVALADGSWTKAMDDVRGTCGLAGVTKKNGVLITRTVEKLWSTGERFALLGRLADTLFAFAQQVDQT